MAKPVTPNDDIIGDLSARIRLPPPPPVALKRQAEVCAGAAACAMTIAEFCGIGLSIPAGVGLGGLVCLVAVGSFCLILQLTDTFPIRICQTYPESVRRAPDRDTAEKKYQQAFKDCYTKYVAALNIARLVLSAALAAAALLRAAGRVTEANEMAALAGKTFVTVQEELEVLFQKCMSGKGFPDAPRPPYPAKPLPGPGED